MTTPNLINLDDPDTLRGPSYCQPQTDTPIVDGLDYGDQSIFPGPGYGLLWELARNFERELTRYKRLEALLRDRADADVHEGRQRMNAEMRVLVDWENGE
jgi:hypothetical protein